MCAVSSKRKVKPRGSLFIFFIYYFVLYFRLINKVSVKRKTKVFPVSFDRLWAQIRIICIENNYSRVKKCGTTIHTQRDEI